MNQPTISYDAVDRAKRIELILLDVDGVLTDGLILVIPDAQGVSHEYKMFNTQDGLGLSIARHLGLRFGLISGRASETVTARARELGIEIVEQATVNKLEVYDRIKQKTKLEDSQIAFMGDDIQDLPPLRRVGLAIGPANARDDIRKYLHLITSREGGRGAVREALEFIIRAQGMWEQVMSRYLE
jgi:3-deoxy-D-manno-octulosonate 8-phosphate phosphatase (KDO 8-P phosphatase)